MYTSPHRIVALSSCVVLLALPQDSVFAAERDPSLATTMMEVFPLLKSNAEPRFAVPLPVVQRWISTQLNAAFEPVSDAPLSHVLQAWTATVVVEGDAPAVDVVMRVRVFRADLAVPVVLRLFPESVVYDRIEMNGKSVDPHRNGGWSLLSISRPGDYVVRSRLSMVPDQSGAQRAIALFPGDFVMPLVRVDSDAAMDVSLEGSTQRLSGTEAAGTHGRLATTKRGSVTLRWGPKVVDRVRKGVLTLEPDIAWQVQDRVLSANAQVTIGVLGGERQEVDLLLPEGADHITVRGADLKQTRIEGRRVRLHFNEPLRGRTIVQLRFEIPKPDGSRIRLPDIGGVDGMLSREGWVIVTDDVEGQIFEHSRSGLRVTSELELPTQVAGLAVGDPVLIYLRSSRAASVTLDHVKTTAFPLVDTIADSAVVRVLVRASGDEIVTIRYMVRNNKSQYLRLTLPSGAALAVLKVDGKERAASATRGTTLIPLVRSVQTLGGLVSFPVDITYLNRGARFVPKQTRRLDLPELMGVPTASISVVAWCPNGVHVAKGRGALQHVDALRTGVRALQLSRRAEPDAVADQRAFENRLGANYWSAGYEAYRENRLEDAEALLTKAGRYTKDETIVANTAKLMGNIQLGRGGQAAGASRQEKAKAEQIRATLQVGNNVLEAEQTFLIEQGIALIQQGSEDLGGELLEEADRLNDALGSRGNSVQWQAVQNKRYKGALKKVQGERVRQERLTEQLAVLQVQADEVVGTRSQTSLILSDELASLSETLNVSDAELQNSVFQYAGKAQTEVEAVHQKARLRNALKNPVAETEFQKDLGGSSAQSSLSEANRKLEQQVTILSQALQNTQSRAASKKPIVLRSEKRLKGQARAAQQKSSEALQRVRNLRARITEGTQGELGGQEIDRELKELGAWGDRNINTYGQVAKSVDRELSGLLAEIKEAEGELKLRRDALKVSDVVSFDAADILVGEGINPERQLNQFLAANLRSNANGEVASFSISGGKVHVKNDVDNLDVVLDGLSNFRSNGGAVVSVSGQNILNPSVESNPALADLFSKKTQDGRSFAILDQAQYQTIVQASNTGDSAGQPTTESAQRDVIVGSKNQIANEFVTVSQSGADFTGLTVGGSAIALGHDALLCINNGTTLTFLRAGEVRGWGDVAAVENPLSVSGGHDLVLPELGQSLMFEKTLLAAGESPDIFLTVTPPRR